MPVEGGQEVARPRGRVARSVLGAAIAVLALLVVAPGCGTDDPAEAHGADGAGVDAQPSSGCAAPDAGLAASSAATVESDGAPRPYLLHVPDGPPDDPRPLVMNIHGAFSTADHQLRVSGFLPIAEQEDVVLVAPEAERPPGRDAGIWQLAPDSRDVDYLFDLLDHVEARLCIDTNRVYLTGFSQGGILAQVMSCRAPERFAALAPVAGLVAAAGCDDSPAVPLVAAHGTADETIGFDGDIPGALAPFIGYEQGPGVLDLARAWAEGNGCTGEPSEARVADDVERLTYPCEGAPVELYVIDEGEHTWPGSPGAGEFDATAAIWAFFERQALD